jgi:hypothetical protein
MSIKNLIAILLVLIFVISVIFISGFVLMGFIDKDTGLDLLKNVMASTSGFVGIIVGHYFSGAGDGRLEGRKILGVNSEASEKQEKPGGE